MKKRYVNLEQNLEVRDQTEQVLIRLTWHC